MSDDLAMAVRQARESSGLSVDQLSARTKIRPVVLCDLEAGSTLRSGGAAYARGHLRAIARATGADAGELLAAHDRSAAQAASVAAAPGPPGGATLPVGAVLPGGALLPVGAVLTGGAGLADGTGLPGGPGTTVGTGLPGGGLARGPVLRGGSVLSGGAGSPVGALPLGALAPPTATRERRGPRWGLALLAAAAVLAGLMIVGVLADDSGPGAPLAGPPTPTPDTGAPPAPPDAAAPPGAVPAPGAALRLEVSGGDSWVDVLSEGGETLFRGVLAAGSAREWSDPALLSVTVGNAGAVTVGCGGDDVAAGRSGQVRRYTCAPDGLAPA